MSVKTSPRRAARQAALQIERAEVPVIIQSRFSIAAAHQQAFAEDSYRGCRVYGMGTRPNAR